MKKSLLIHRTLTIGILLFCITAGPAHTMAAEPQRVALLPFKINAEKDLTYLQNGIFDMLSSRLAEPGKVQVLSRGEVDNALAGAAGPQDETAARNLGKKLGTDYVLYGSLTMFGDSLSIDAKMVDVTGAKPPVAVFSQSPDVGGIIPAIDRFATDINARVFDRGTTGAAVAAAPVPAAPQPGTQDDSRAHPEKLYQRGETQVSPFITPKDLVLQSPNMWKSPNYKYLINGMAIGDVDGDGKSEIVVVSPDEIYVYRLQEGQLREITRQDVGSERYNIGVDVADINGNGRAEIFVTALTRPKNVVRSYVKEFDGKAFVEIAHDLPWFFRVTDLPARGRILLGQESRLYAPYRGGLYEMQWDGGAYVPGNPIITPREQVNVLGVALGDVLNAGEETLVAIDRDNRIVIASPSGEALWISGDKYGGSTLYVNGEKTDQGQEENPIYLPTRILVRNSPDDKGKSQVIAVNNHEIMNMHWNRRDFTSAQIDAFAWDGVGLAPAWSTRKMTGIISDVQIADFDGDGRQELVIALVTKTGSIALTTPKSTLIAYELEAMSPGPPQASGQ
ncbi:MAG: FG-GAP-like repeat-containing protein [Desulfobacterales bacterium]